MTMEIDRLREKIDQLDDEIVRLLNRRAVLVLKVGEMKKRRGLPVRLPRRETKVLDQVQEQNRGPLSNKAVRRIFERIIDEMRGLEEKKPILNRRNHGSGNGTWSYRGTDRQGNGKVD